MQDGIGQNEHLQVFLVGEIRAVDHGNRHTIHLAGDSHHTQRIGGIRRNGNIIAV